MRYTIEDLRAGKVAIANDGSGSVDDLRMVLGVAFPDDIRSVYGRWEYYLAYEEDSYQWYGNYYTYLPTQPLTDFVSELYEPVKMPQFIDDVVKGAWYHVEAHLPSDVYDGVVLEVLTYNGTTIKLIWDSCDEAFKFTSGNYCDRVKYWKYER